MPRFGSRKAALETYGMEATARRGWSARSPNGKAVAGCFWIDQFEGGPRGRRRYKGNPVGDAPNEHPDSYGFREWRDNLNWAWNSCNHRIRILEVHRGATRNTFRAVPETIMRLDHLDQQTGAFEAHEEPA